MLSLKLLLAVVFVTIIAIQLRGLFACRRVVVPESTAFDGVENPRRRQ